MPKKDQSSTVDMGDIESVRKVYELADTDSDEDEDDHSNIITDFDAAMTSGMDDYHLQRYDDLLSDI